MKLKLKKKKERTIRKQMKVVQKHQQDQVYMICPEQIKTEMHINPKEKTISFRLIPSKTDALKLASWKIKLLFIFIKSSSSTFVCYEADIQRNVSSS
jgi:hypothetical protein